MEFNLKKNKRTDAETFEHCLTILSALFQACDDEFDFDIDKSNEKWKQAKEYLQQYIYELFLQNNH